MTSTSYLRLVRRTLWRLAERSNCTNRQSTATTCLDHTQPPQCALCKLGLSNSILCLLVVRFRPFYHIWKYDILDPGPAPLCLFCPLQILPDSAQRCPKFTTNESNSATYTNPMSPMSHSKNSVWPRQVLHIMFLGTSFGRLCLAFCIGRSGTTDTHCDMVRTHFNFYSCQHKRLGFYLRVIIHMTMCELREHCSVSRSACSPDN
jgi:hypothetical protein